MSYLRMRFSKNDCFSAVCSPGLLLRFKQPSDNAIGIVLPDGRQTKSGPTNKNICFKIWQPPAFPYRRQYSIPGRLRLDHRVRDENGYFPKSHHHQKFITSLAIK